MLSEQEPDRSWLNSLTLNQPLQEIFARLLENDDKFSMAAHSFSIFWPILTLPAIHRSGIPWI